MAAARIPGPIGLDPHDMRLDRRMDGHLGGPGPIGLTPAPFSSDGPLLDHEKGLQIVLSPLQLAAVLEGSDFEPAGAGTTADRWWGAASVLGGALELVGAAALLAVPEPTMLTKGAGAALGAHGLDTVGAGVRQIWTGQPQETLTSSGVRATAEALSVDPETARKIGIGADFVLPLFAGGVGALRALAVRRGMLRLSAHETIEHGPVRGHTISKHVGRSEAQLLQRLQQERRIAAATTFTDLRSAERFVSQAMTAHRQSILQWARSGAKGDLRFSMDLGRTTGWGIARGSTTTQSTSRIYVQLRRVQAGGSDYFVLTAYPLL